MYRYPKRAKESLEEILQNLEGKGIVESSIAAWLYPAFLVNKAGGNKRLCLDYRKVNKQLKELVKNVSRSDHYATLDMIEAYYYVLQHQLSRDLTTYTDGISMYRFKRLPFGLSRSPAILATSK